MKAFYLINGFLDGGKSDFLQYTLSQPYFQISGRTLLLLCEEGEVEFAPALLEKHRVDVAVLESEEQLESGFLRSLERRYGPDRIVMEYNGMWPLKGRTWPRHWQLEQQITLLDGGSFALQYANFRSLLGEMVRNSHLIIVNRCDGLDQELAKIRRSLRAANGQAQIVFENAQGEMDIRFQDDLPFDMDQEPIEVDLEDYGAWYLDCLERGEAYAGRSVRFVARVARPAGLPVGYMLPGRMAMTCCAEDMVWMAYPCRYGQGAVWEPGQWLQLCCRVQMERLPGMSMEAPVLELLEAEPVERPAQELVLF